MFVDVARLIEEEYNWEGFDPDFARLNQAYACAPQELAEQIDVLYDTTVTFGSYLEMDQDLRENPQGNKTALTASHRRQFEDIVRSIAPFVRRFPAGREMDEETGAFLHELSGDLAKRVVIAARQNDVITSQDAERVRALLAAIEREGLPARKAQTRGEHTARNLVLATVWGMVGMVGARTLDKTELFQKVTQFLASNVDEAIEIVVDAPVDVRAAVESVLRGIREAQGDAPTGRDEIMDPSSNRRRRD
ncbi:MAG: hypothetical protein AAF468_10100 [Pseudomonadota bacterium]